jgi:hypothetical protein
LSGEIPGHYFVSATRAAKLCGRSDRTVRRWLASGKLCGRKIAWLGEWEIDVADLPITRREEPPTRDYGRELDELRRRVEALERALWPPLL